MNLSLIQSTIIFNKEAMCVTIPTDPINAINLQQHSRLKLFNKHRNLKSF